MIQTFKNRTIDPSIKIFVYQNLHKKMWSIKQTGLVVAHADSLFMREAKFTVSEVGRQRVIKEKKKNVHAGIVGYLAASIELKATHNHSSVGYNPYLAGVFYDRSYGPIKAIINADWVDLDINRNDKVLAIWED